MPTNKISKVQLNDIQYLLKGDADNIREVMASIVSDLYSRIDTGSDNTTIQNIIERLSNVEEGKASQEQIEELWEQINNLSGKIPNSTINYFFAYKTSNEAPDRPTNTEEYPPQGWKSYPESPDSDEVVYMTTARKVNNSWQNWADGYRWTQPIAYSEKSQQTLSIESNIALYKLSSGTPSLSEQKRKTPSYPEGWSTTPDFVVQNNQEVYMITAKTINGKYQLINGYYWSSPMRIGGGTTSSTGSDTTVYNYVYFPSNSATAPDAPSSLFTVRQIEEAHEMYGWYDRPQGISEGQKYEYVSLSVGEGLDRNNWSQPVLWSKWGERGMDGDGVEYVYTRRSNYSPAPSLTFNVSDEGYQQDDYLPKDENNEFWKDQPQGVTYEYPYEFVATRKQKNGVWQQFTGPALWAKFGKDGSGNQGLNGAVIRYIGDWSSVVENANNHEFTFECNTPEGANVRYIDVVTMPATGGGLDYYQCKLAYITDANSPSPDQDSTHWEPAQHFKFLVTDTLIANVIAARSISANDVVIKEGEGQNTSIVAGMTSSTAKYSTLGDVRIWSGTEGDQPNIQEAPFIVNNEGGLYARNANIWGNINAISGSFCGNVAATSLSVMDNDKVLMQFMPAPAGIENIPEGAPALFIFYNDQSYIVNMIPVNSQSGTITTYTSKEYYVVVSGQESNMYTKLEQCHIYNGQKYYSEHVKAHNDSSIGLTQEHSYWYCNSNDSTINNRVFTDANKTQLLSGICIDPSIYNEFTRDYNAASNTGTYKAFYQVWSYTDGIKAQQPGKIVIGTWHTTEGVIDRSDFQDIGLTQPYTAPALYSNYTRPISYSELSTQMQISNGYAPNPGQID